MYCQKCGRERIEGTRYCIKCGTPFDIPENRGLKTGNNHIVPIVTAVIGLLLIVGWAYFLFFSGTGEKKETAGSSMPAEYQQQTTVAADESQNIVGVTEAAPASEEIAHDEPATVTETVPADGENGVGYLDPLLPTIDVNGLNDLDLENEILRIREVFNKIQKESSSYKVIEKNWGTIYDGGFYKKAVVRSGYQDVFYERWYYYEDDQLIFAFYYSGSDEQRFYFYRNLMFRWKDNDVTHDLDFEEPRWYYVEEEVFTEGYKVIRFDY